MSNLLGSEQMRSVVPEAFAAIAKEAGKAVVNAIQNHPIAGLCVFGFALTSPFLYAVYKGHGLEMQVGILSLKTT